MAMTAWETYVEDRLQEAVAQRLVGVSDSDVARFINKRLKEEIKRLHSPVSKKTIELFQDYANVDLTAAWCWNNHDPKTVKTKLNALIQLRGDVVHRSRKVTSGPPEPHPVTKAGLEKAISFLKSLVDATEKAFDPSP